MGVARSSRVLQEVLKGLKSVQGISKGLRGLQKSSLGCFRDLRGYPKFSYEFQMVSGGFGVSGA